MSAVHGELDCRYLAKIVAAGRIFRRIEWCYRTVASGCGVGEIMLMNLEGGLLVA